MTREEKLAKLLDKAIEKLDKDLDDDGKRGPQLYEAIRRLMIDNDIQALPVPGSGLKKLDEKVAASLPFPKAATG